MEHGLIHRRFVSFIFSLFNQPNPYILLHNKRHFDIVRQSEMPVSWRSTSWTNSTSEILVQTRWQYTGNRLISLVSFSIFLVILIDHIHDIDSNMYIYGNSFIGCIHCLLGYLFTGICNALRTRKEANLSRKWNMECTSTTM